MAKKDQDLRTAEEIGMEVISAMDKEFHHESDRVIAIVGAAYLDDVIGNLLRKIFISDSDVADNILRPDAPLGSNGSRYQLAFCLGLIRKHQFDDLKLAAKIRNYFAHNYKCSSFDEAPVRDWCAAFQQPKFFEAMPTKLFRPEVSEQMSAYVKSLSVTPRQKFETTIICLFGSLLRRVNFVTVMDESKWFRQNADPDIP